MRVCAVGCLQSEMMIKPCCQGVFDLLNWEIKSPGAEPFFGQGRGERGKGATRKQAGESWEL